MAWEVGDMTFGQLNVRTEAFNIFFNIFFSTYFAHLLASGDLHKILKGISAEK
jgi:hypothetical protein